MVSPSCTGVTWGGSAPTLDDVTSGVLCAAPSGGSTAVCRALILLLLLVDLLVTGLVGAITCKQNSQISANELVIHFRCQE